MIQKIISGGQTGADRAALDVAFKLGIPHGGWIPKGRIAEDGPLPTDIWFFRKKYVETLCPAPFYFEYIELVVSHFNKGESI